MFIGFFSTVKYSITLNIPKYIVSLIYKSNYGILGGISMSFLKKIPIAFTFLFDKDVPFKKKILLIIGIIYFALPIDFIPEPILLLGFIDDIAILAFVLTKLSSDLDEYIKNKEIKKKNKDIKGKIIENVEYDIKDDKDDLS